jgi:hypothetical protein
LHTPTLLPRKKAPLTDTTMQSFKTFFSSSSDRTNKGDSRKRWFSLGARFSTNNQQKSSNRDSSSYSGLTSRSNSVMTDSSKSEKKVFSPGTITRRKSYLSNSSLTMALRRDSHLRREFENFAGKLYAAEGVLFLEDLIQWQSEGSLSREGAKVLLETYIVEGAPHQVNISYDARTTVEKNFHSSAEAECREDMFERASREVRNMMIEGGAWGMFVWRGGCDKLEMVEDIEII